MSDQQKMAVLAATFPALRVKREDPFNGLSPWNAERLIEVSARWSEREKIVVSFLLSVWNSREAPQIYGQFDAVEARKILDDANWSAFVAWANAPFYC